MIIPFSKALLALLLTSASFGTTNAEDVVTTSNERPISKFKVGDDWLALPEVFSNLDFNADNAPADESDIEAQMYLRSTRFWGRLYIDGWPQSIQFFRAHFGKEAPYGRKRFVFAEPRDACTQLENAHLITSDHVLLVNRGTCTYGNKAKTAKAAGASGIVIINNEPGIDHLPGPDAHDIDLSVSSISQQEGQLLEVFYDEGPMEDGFGRKMEGYLVPINCELSGAKCLPASYEERRWLKDMNEGGTLTLNGVEQNLEYLLAQFGMKSTHESVEIPLAMAKPAEACDPLQKDYKGKAVLVRRGTCSFVQKAENVQAAGGAALIVGSVHAHLLRMGVEPRWKGLNTVIPVAMVSKSTYSTLVAESFVGGKIAMVENSDVNATVWEELEKLGDKDAWPRSDVYLDKKFDELQEQHKEWPDRVVSVKDSYQKVTAGRTKSEL